ncbi:trigger factor [Candidatus Magnetoovum chiemensis]|nr:trigger factor [Candidatus Magnetoovum chiemensis]
MNSIVEDISATKKKITIEATADEVEDEIKKALNDVRVKTKIPGYRIGKAPLSLIEKRFGRDVESDVFGRLITQYYMSAVKDANLRPLTQPEFIERAIERKSGIKMVCSIDVRPDIGEFVYKELPVTERTSEVSDEEAELGIKRLQASKSAYEPSDGAVQYDDLVIADYKVMEDDKTYSDQYIKIGASNYPVEFHDALVGKKKDDIAQKTLTISEGFHYPELVGRTVNLKITIKDVKKLVMPSLDDEFAKDVGYNSLEELRNKIKESLLIYKKEQDMKEQKGELVKMLVDKHDFEVPETVLNREIDLIVSQAKTHDKYRDKSTEELKAEFRQEAVRSVKAMVLFDIIGEKENINVSDEELESKIKLMANAYSMTPEALVQYYQSRDGSLDGFRYVIFREKVADFIYSQRKAEQSTKEPIDKAIEASTEEKPKE